MQILLIFQVWFMDGINHHRYIAMLKFRLFNSSKGYPYSWWIFLCSLFSFFINIFFSVCSAKIFSSFCYRLIFPTLKNNSHSHLWESNNSNTEILGFKLLQKYLQVWKKNWASLLLCSMTDIFIIRLNLNENI